MSNEEEGYEPTFVTLVSNEGDTYDVEVAVATQSEVLKDLLTNLPDADDDIPLANVNTRTLIKVIEWCTHYRDVPAADEKDLDTEPVKRTDDMNTWDKAFLDVDPTMLYELVSAANYLNIERLLAASCKAIAGVIQGKTVEELRTTLGVESDFTAAEEERFRKDIDWCEER